MRTSASEHVNKTLSSHHAAACEHPRLQQKWHALGRVRVTQGQVGLRECSLMPAMGSVGLCWWEGRGAVVCTQAPMHKGGEVSICTGQHTRHCGAGREMQESFFLTVYTTRFGCQRVNVVKKSLEGFLPAINRTISIHRMWQAAKGVPLFTSLLFQGDSLLCSVSHLGSET